MNADHTTAEDYRDRPHTVYLHMNAAGEVIYVGCTSNLEQRTAAHKRRALWRDEIAEVRVESVHPTMETGQAREYHLIWLFEPKHNHRGNPRREREEAAEAALREFRREAWRATPECAALEAEREARVRAAIEEISVVRVVTGPLSTLLPAERAS